MSIVKDGETPTRQLFEHYIIGVSIGPSAQQTALAVIEQEIRCQGSHTTTCRELRLRHLDRLPLGASDPEIVGKVKEIVEAVEKQEGDTKTDLVVDITGVGHPILSLMRDEELDPIAVTITGGTGETEAKSDDWRIAKPELVSNLKLQYQLQRLKTAPRLDLADTFVEEMMKFKPKAASLSTDDFEAWREGAHDDLVFAVAVAVWRGSRYVPPNKKAWAERMAEFNKEAVRFVV